MMLFCVAAVFVLYTYVGYPALLSLRARRQSGRPELPPAPLPRVAVVIPAYNEAASIAIKIRQVLQSRYPQNLLRVIVISDGSTDATVSEARRIGDPRLTIIDHELRCGKMAAVNAAMVLVHEPVVVMTDAGEMFDEDTIPRLVVHFADPAVGAVSGELGLVALHSAFSQTLGVYWRYEKWIRAAEATIGSVVGVTGPVYALRRDLYRPMPEDTVLDDLAIPLEIIKQGYKVGYERRAFAFERATQGSDHEFIRKCRTLAGNYQAIARYWRLLLPTSPIAWQFWSHKVFRLLVPYALIGVFVGGMMLPPPAALIVTGVQIMFYGLAALMAWTHVPRRRWMIFPYTFCVFNWAAVAGSYMYVSGRLNVRWEKVK
ncbi:MAG: glycosyltransferase family 2 protein [Acidiferrobacter sp.]